MEKVKEKRTSLLATDLGLRIAAVIIAVIIWLFLSITEYPTINKTITNVPVVFSMDGTSASEKGLQAQGYKDITVDVEIKGMNYEIGSYGANDLVATVNVDSVSKEGTYPLEINVRSVHSSDTVNIVSVSPDTVDVSFVHKGSDVFEVTANAPNVIAAEGLTLRNPAVSPSTVMIEGAETELAKIKRVEAVIEDSATLSDATSISTEKVFFYDEDGIRLDGSKYTLVDTKKFDVSFDLYKKKTVNLSVDFTDVPPGFDISSIPYELSATSVNVITPKLNDVNVQAVSLGTVSLKDIDLGKSFSFDVNQKLQSGEINQSGVDTVIMTFGFEEKGYIKKEFSVPASAIRFSSPPSGRSVKLETKQIPSVTLFGPKETVEKLDSSDINVVVDLADVTQTGSLSHSVTVYVPKADDVWCIGSNEVQINIEEKAAAITDSSSAADSSSASDSSS